MMPTCFNVSVYQMDLQPASGGTCRLQFYGYSLLTEYDERDTSVGGDSSGESFISISYSKGCKSYASFEVTDIWKTSVKKCF